MAFKLLKGIPDDANEFLVATIGNTKTIAVGDALVPLGTGHTKFVGGAASSSTTIIGVCVAILNAQNGPTGLDSVTTGGSNETTVVYKAQYLPLTFPGLWTATLSAAAGTTTDSDGIGSFNLNATNNTLDETSIALVTATEKQFFSFGLDPSDTTKKTVIGVWCKALTP